MNFILDPGETIDIKVDMHAPKQPGSYETTWIVGTNKERFVQDDVSYRGEINACRQIYSGKLPRRR